MCATGCIIDSLPCWALEFLTETFRDTKLQREEVHPKMLKIRLRRVGAKKHPSYRIVVADSRAARDGAFVEQIGHYDPMTDPPTVTLDEEKARAWIVKGAQPTEAVARMLTRIENAAKAEEAAG